MTAVADAPSTGAPAGDGPRPFFASEVTSPPPARRLLLLTMHFAPSPTVGGLRWERMAAFAVERGWGVDVICLDPAHVARPDAARLAALPPNVRVFGAPPLNVRVHDVVLRLGRLLRRRRAPGAAAAASSGSAGEARPGTAAGPTSDTAHGVPRDAVLRPWQGLVGAWRAYNSWRWVAAERQAAAEYLRRARRLVDPSHAAIVTSGPLHFVHIAGRELAEWSGLPWIMDMRDPWSLGERIAVDIASSVFLNSARRAEARAVRGASLVVSNTELAAQALRERYPEAAERIITVMNGSDEEPLPVARAGDGPARFTIGYAGAIYYDRTPRQLFAAVARVVRELGLGPADLRVAFMGMIDPGDADRIRATAAAEGVEDYVVQLPPGPRAAALEFMASAAMLVSLPQDTETAIPSKVFEYARFPAWLLALARPGSATALVLRDSGADVVAPDDVDALADVIGRRYREFRAGGRPQPVGGDGRFSRRRQAERLLARLDALTGGARPATR